MMVPGWKSTAEGILFTDQYQLTMAQLYFRMGMHELTAQFDHFFRSYPNYGDHQAGYCINAGLEWLFEWMQQATFRPEDIEALRDQRDPAGKRIFADDFLRWLPKNEWYAGLTVRAIPEGRVVHGNVPLTVVQGPLAMAQLLETTLLNHLNYQTLIATKAARIKQAGRGQLLLEFGLRRGPDTGANAGARAALIGGADYTSNVGISQALSFPPKGTHAHSMVQAFIALGGTELDAFRAYAEVYPDDCLLLVDTVDTLNSGLPNAIKVFDELKRKGHSPVGIRLDSGDLAYLSVMAAKMLNAAGFNEARIVLSNQLDELVVWQILTQIEHEAGHYGIDPEKLIKRLVYGVGTRMITSQGHTALDGVYKLVAIQQGPKWLPAIKISETLTKVPNPGHKHVWRIYDGRGKATADLLSLSEEEIRPHEKICLYHPIDAKISRTMNAENVSETELLLEDIMLDGKVVYNWPSIDSMRTLRDRDLQRLDAGVKRIMNPHIYHVSITKKLWDLKQELINHLEVSEKNASLGEL
jgi:nicotinate phosphoribosyltransferase